MTTATDILNDARLGLGNGAVQHIDDADAEADKAVYLRVVRDLLSRYPWSFARRVRPLARLAGAPPVFWTYRYALPADLLGSPRAVYDDPTLKVAFTDWELYVDDAAPAKELWTSAEAIFMVYGVMADPQVWPGYFGNVVVKAIQSELAQSLREDRTLAADLREQAFGPPSMMGAGGLMGQARTLDAQGQPSRVMAVGRNPLIDVRG